MAARLRAAFSLPAVASKVFPSTAAGGTAGGTAAAGGTAGITAGSTAGSTAARRRHGGGRRYKGVRIGDHPQLVRRRVVAEDLDLAAQVVQFVDHVDKVCVAGAQHVMRDVRVAMGVIQHFKHHGNVAGVLSALWTA